MKAQILIMNEPDQPDELMEARLDLVTMLALEIATHVKDSGIISFQIPMIDESGMWVVSVKRMGISEGS